MLAAACRASPRPAAANQLRWLAANRAMAVAAMPVGEAQRAGELGRILGIELGEQAESNRRRRGWRQRRKARRIAVQAEKQQRIPNPSPGKLTVRLNERQSIGPLQLACIGARR